MSRLTRPACPPKQPLPHATQRPEAAINSVYLSELALTSRDRQVLEHLGEIGYATTDQLARLFFGLDRPALLSAQRRLKQLWERHILDRTPGQDLLRYGLPLQLVYSPGLAGVRLLSDGDENLKLRRGIHLQAHNVLLGEALVRLALAAQTAGWESDYQGERSAYSPFQWEGQWIKMRPDGRLVLQRLAEERTLSFFLEMDTSVKEIDVYLAKISQYERYYRSRAWQERYRTFPGIAVIVWAGTDTGDPTRCPQQARTRQQRILDLVRAQRKDRDLVWFFTTLDQIGTGRWQALTAQGEIRETHFFEGREP
jgi:hypothetical protein